MDILFYILFGILILSIAVMVGVILIKAKPINQIEIRNYPAGKRILDETLMEDEIVDLLKEHYNKKNIYLKD